MFFFVSILVSTLILVAGVLLSQLVFFLMCMVRKIMVFLRVSWIIPSGVLRQILVSSFLEYSFACFKSSILKFNFLFVCCDALLPVLSLFYFVMSFSVSLVNFLFLLLYLIGSLGELLNNLAVRTTTVTSLDNENYVFSYEKHNFFKEKRT